jgi:hypothetical protein
MREIAVVILLSSSFGLIEWPPNCEKLNMMEGWMDEWEGKKLTAIPDNPRAGENDMMESG